MSHLSNTTTTTLQDEADVFSVCSHLGRNHKKFVGSIVKETFEEVRLFRV